MEYLYLIDTNSTEIKILDGEVEILNSRLAIFHYRDENNIPARYEVSPIEGKMLRNKIWLKTNDILKGMEAFKTEFEKRSRKLRDQWFKQLKIVNVLTVALTIYTPKE